MRLGGPHLNNTTSTSSKRKGPRANRKGSIQRERKRRNGGLVAPMMLLLTTAAVAAAQAPAESAPAKAAKQQAKAAQKQAKKAKQSTTAGKRRAAPAHSRPEAAASGTRDNAELERLDMLALEATAKAVKAGRAMTADNPRRPLSDESDVDAPLGQVWFVKDGMPPYAEVAEQLRMLRSRNRPGSKASAEAKMARGLKKARQAADAAGVMGGAPTKSAGWRHLVKDGEASAEWRARLERGENPPVPFRTGGLRGANGAFSLSAVREALLRAHQTRPSESAASAQADEASGEVSVPRVRVSAKDYVEALRPPGEEGAPLPSFLASLAEGALDEGEDFWRCVAHEAGVSQTSMSVKVLVEEAKRRAHFHGLPGGRKKSDAVWLFELCVHADRRVDAIRALAWLGAPHRDRARSFKTALLKGSNHLDGIEMSEDHSEWMDAMTDAPVVDGEWKDRLDMAFTRLHPPAHKPPVTEAGKPDYHPWLGHVGTVTFGELAAGAGHFAAHFNAAGAECAYVVEPRPEVLERATANAGGTPQAFDSVMSVDPVDLPWTHILVGGAE